MNHEELAFFNQQLAAMLQSGLPLESSMKHIAASMNQGPLRAEIEQLESDLAQGTPLNEAIGKRKLPELYVALVKVGIQSGNLPAALILIADYYQRLHTTWIRLKGLLVYPAILLIASLMVSGFMAFLYTRVVRETSNSLSEMIGGGSTVTGLIFATWLPVIVLVLAATTFLVVVSLPVTRRSLRWKVPAFREASLAQLASALAMLLESGCQLDSALELLERNEMHPAARSELHQWRQRLSEGARGFADVAGAGNLVPPLFVWLVATSGENWARGFRRAADVYSARAQYRIDLFLYAALPLAILVVAVLIASEFTPIMGAFVRFMNILGGPDNGFGE